MFRNIRFSAAILLLAPVLSIVPAGAATPLSATNSWASVASMSTARLRPAAVAGADGRIYVLGGGSITGGLATVEAYTPGTNTWTSVAPMSTARSEFAAATGTDGRIYALGGRSADGTVLSTVEVYAPATNTWAAVAPMLTARSQMTAATGADGRIYVLGGYNTGLLATVEAYTPATNTWAAVAPLPSGRSFLAAAAGADGRIYALGGGGAGGAPMNSTATVEAYTPATNTWAPVASMSTSREALAAATGVDGRIYALGGYNAAGAFLATAEAYTPATNSWSPIPSMSIARIDHGAATGPDGHIYAIGGESPNSTGTGPVATVEAYTPPGPPSTIVFTSSPVSGPAATSANLGPITLTLKDSSGNPTSAPPGGIQASLTSSSTAGRFALTSGGGAVMSATIAAGTTQTSIFYGDSRAGTPGLTAAATGLTSATQVETITGPVDHLVLAPGTASIRPESTNAYTAEGFDASGNDLGSMTAGTTFSIGPDGACSSTMCTATVPGVHTVTGTHGIAVGTASLLVLDITAPSVIITVHPNDTTTATSATFGVSAIDPGNTAGSLSTTSSLDGAPFSAAGYSASFTGLAVGPHTFTVRSVDPTGNIGSASFAWTIRPVRSGYWMVGSDGTVYAFGDAESYGNAPTVSAVDVEPTPSGNGYWVVDDLGRVFAFGDAVGRGNVDRAKLAQGEKATSLSATKSGNGYWIFTSRGRALTFGDAPFLGDVSGLTLAGPVLDSIPTPSGAGYYMVASDGGIFAFGDATFYGSMGGKKLNAPVQSLVPDADGVGYWLVAADGGIFAFQADFRGSMGGTKLNKPVTGMVRAGGGYLMVGEDGGIFDFSGTPDGFKGSLGANPPAKPITSVAVLEDK